MVSVQNKPNDNSYLNANNFSIFQKILVGSLTTVLVAAFFWLISSVYTSNTSLALIENHLQQMKETMQRHVVMMERQEKRIDTMDRRISALDIKVARIEQKLD